MRTILFSIFLLPAVLFAQEKAPEQQPARFPFTLKTAPLNLINPFQFSVDVMSDIPVATNWSIEMGVGLVLDSKVFAQYKGDTYRGIKLKPTVKHYFSRTADSDDYFGLALKYNYLQEKHYFRVSRQGEQYWENQLTRRHIHTWGAAFRFGTQQYVGAHKRFIIEPFGALGIRQSFVSFNDLPPDAAVVEGSGWFAGSRVAGIYTTPDFMLGISMGWRLTSR